MLKTIILILSLILATSACATFRGQQALGENQEIIQDTLHVIRNDILLLQLMIINMDKYQDTDDVDVQPYVDDIWIGDDPQELTLTNDSNSSLMEVTDATNTITERTCEYKGKIYIVEYQYNDGYFSVPLTNPLGAPHYDARITVYEIDRGRRKQIAETFNGQYVEGGCFEDRPESLVKRALGMEKTANIEITTSPFPEEDPYPEPSIRWLYWKNARMDGFQIGLRDDGVVVWREKK